MYGCDEVVCVSAITKERREGGKMGKRLGANSNNAILVCRKPLARWDKASGGIVRVLGSVRTFLSVRRSSGNANGNQSKCLKLFSKGWKEGKKRKKINVEGKTGIE